MTVCHRNRWCIKVLNLLPRLHSQFLLLTKSTVTVNAKYVHPEKYTSTPNWVYVETSLRCCNISKFFEHIPDQVKRRIRLVIMTLVCVCLLHEHVTLSSSQPDTLMTSRRTTSQNSSTFHNRAHLWKCVFKTPTAENWTRSNMVASSKGYTIAEKASEDARKETSLQLNSALTPNCS